MEACEPGSALLDPYPWLDQQTWALFAPWSDRLAALLLNEEELRMELEPLGQDVWTVLKQAERGGTTSNPDLHWQAHPTEVVDLTGAGDAFAARLAAGLIQGKDKSAALEVAARAASWALQGVGASALTTLAMQRP